MIYLVSNMWLILIILFVLLYFFEQASDRCLNEKRKTINGEDILFSMEKLGAYFFWQYYDFNCTCRCVKFIFVYVSHMFGWSLLFMDFQKIK